MPNLGTIAIAVSIIILVGVLYATWRERRRDEDAEGERPGDDPDKQLQRPIWRPGRDK